MYNVFMPPSTIQRISKPSVSPRVERTQRTNNIGRSSPANSNRNFHSSQGYSKVINFSHLKSYFTLDGEVVGHTQIIDKEKGQKVGVEVRRVQEEGGLETYKLVVDNEVIAFHSLKIVTEDKDSKNRSSLGNSIWKRSPLNGFGSNKKRQAKVVGEFNVNRYPNKYSRTLDVFMQLISDRMQELEKSQGIKFQGLQIVTIAAQCFIQKVLSYRIIIVLIHGLQKNAINIFKKS